MIRLRHKFLIQSFRIIDQFVLVATGFVVIFFRQEVLVENEIQNKEFPHRLEDAFYVVLLIVGWVAIFNYFIRYHSDRLVAIDTQLKKLLHAACISSLWLIIVTATFSERSLHTAQVFAFFTTVGLLGAASRISVHHFLLQARKSGLNYRYLLVVGANKRALRVATRIDEKPELGYKITGFVAESSAALEEWGRQKPAKWMVLGLLDSLRDVLIAGKVDEVIVCLPADTRFIDVKTIVKHASDLGIVVRLLPETDDGLLLKNIHVEDFDGDCVVTFFREKMLMHLFLKRLMDASLSLAALILFSPLITVVAILVKLSSPGPVLFRQNRVGMNQRQFKLLKFRSMVMDAEERLAEVQHLNEQDGPAFKIKNDPRTTCIGRFLRKTSIDELPQLLNVLRGEMSLVGPRPPLPEEVKRYEWFFRKRLSVKPGVTCIWQISGRNSVRFDHWMQMDHEYIENWSVWLDIKILLFTIPAVLFSRGAS